jgi:hypothetical protein
MTRGDRFRFGTGAPIRCGRPSERPEELRAAERRRR